MKNYKATDPEMIQAQKDLAKMSNLLTVSETINGTFSLACNVSIYCLINMKHLKSPVPIGPGSGPELIGLCPWAQI